MLTIRNMERNMKEMRGSTSDIISNLPQSVKETILVCLPIQEAVRTSVLSKKLRESTRKTKTGLIMTIYQTGKLPGDQSADTFPFKQWCLRLRSCVFKSPPEVKGFSRLLELVLYEVVVTADILSSLISNCPLLENLSLKSSGSLDSLEINAPNLRFLCCAETSKLVTLFGSLPVIEFLQLEYDTVRGVPKRLPTSLNNLKTLKLFFVCFEEVNEISVILCLIRSSPNLEKITIVASSTETADVMDPVLELLEMKDWSGVSLNQLQVVQLGGLYGTQSELKFIKLLLAILPVLETKFIQTDTEKVVDEGLRILNEVTRFPHLSPQAEIEFEYKDEDQV
ncbi:unnamed protein product [Camellia sinensis]